MAFREIKRTFTEVLYNWDDQVSVRRLLNELVPEEVKDEIVKRFNQDVHEYNQRVATPARRGQCF